MMANQEPLQAATDQAANVKEVAVGQATDVAREAQSKATDLVQQAKSQLKAEAGNQGERLSGVLRDVSTQMASMAENGAPGTVRDLTGQAASAIGSAADRLGNGGVDGLIDDVTAFARRRPAAFLVGAGLLGFAAARVFRNAPSNGPTSDAPTHDAPTFKGVGAETSDGGAVPPPLVPAGVSLGSPSEG